MKYYIKSVTILILLQVFTGIPALHAYWVEDGVAVCTAMGEQRYPKLISDGAGGAIITWVDSRIGTSYYDIYAQRIDASATVRWTADGVAICTKLGAQLYPQLISDGAGGAIITWWDNIAWIAMSIYAQRIDADGNVLWTAGGVLIGGSAQMYPQLISDGAGGAIITWVDNSNLVWPDIYAQRIDASGNVLWKEHGVAICTATGDQMYPQLTSDGTGGAIIAWHDTRTSEGYSDIYAQRIDASGAVQWTADGVVICEATSNQAYAQLNSDGAGGAIITWDDSRSGISDIYAQRINANGNVQWAADGVAICANSGAQLSPQLISDGAGGAIITWDDSRSGISDIYAQRIDASGNARWTLDGVPVCTATGGQICPELTSDGTEGAIITWLDYRNQSSSSIDIYAARFNAVGEPIATLLQSQAASYSDGAIIIKWTLSEAGENMHFFILRAEELDGTFEELLSQEIVNDGSRFTFRDETGEPGTIYRYLVEVLDEEGRRPLFETEPVTTPALPLTLYQNHPNPFNPVTTIKYYLPEETRVKLEVYDLSGRLVARLAEGCKVTGFHVIEWKGLDEGGNPLASGIYFYRLRAGKERMSRKMLLLR